jgi:hypothetical protein
MKGAFSLPCTENEKREFSMKIPMQGTPSKMATVAGTAPFSLTIASTSFAVFKFLG